MSKTYESLGRLLYRSSLPLLIIYGRISKPRVRAIIFYENKVLLVKNWFGRQEWTFPGGGVKAKESEASALSRELKEELGISLAPHLFEHIATLPISQTSLHYPISIYAVTLNDMDVIKNLSRNRHEITDVRWFDVITLSSLRHQELHDIYNSLLAKKKL